MSPALRALFGSRRDRPWRRSSLCAPGSARWVLRSAPDAFGMPFPPRRASRSLSQPLEHSLARSKCARSRRPADPLERTDALSTDSLAAPRNARNVPGPGAPAAGATRPRPGTLPAAPGDPRPGSEREGPQIPSRLSSHNSLSGFCASPSRPGVRPSWTLAFRPGLFRFSSFLTRLPFLLLSGFPGKVASPSLLKSSPSLRGGWLGTGWGVGGWKV